VLDEFQEVVEIDSGLLKLMRSVFQEQPEVAHVYLGSARHMIERIFNDEHAAAAQRRVLQALAAEQPARPLSGEYRRRHSLPVSATVQTALAALSAAELVVRIGRGEYRIAEPFLAEWIQLNES
jgi:hypothetical protein